MVGTFLGISALMDPSKAVAYKEGADMIAGAWAGRTLGMALTTGLTIGWCPTPEAYTLLFLGAVCREGGDIVGAMNQGEIDTVVVLAAFLALDVLGLVLSARACKGSKTD